MEGVTGKKMSHRKRDAGDEMLGRTDSRWMNRKPFRSLAISPDLSSVQDEFEVDAIKNYERMDGRIIRRRSRR